MNSIKISFDVFKVLIKINFIFLASWHSLVISMDKLQECIQEITIAPGLKKVEVDAQDIEISLKTEEKTLKMFFPELAYLQDARFYQVNEHKHVIRLDDPAQNVKDYPVWQMVITDTPVQKALRDDNKLVIKIAGELAIFIGTTLFEDVRFECEKILAEQSVI